MKMKFESLPLTVGKALIINAEKGCLNLPREILFSISADVREILNGNILKNLTGGLDYYYVTTGITNCGGWIRRWI